MLTSANTGRSVFVKYGRSASTSSRVNVSCVSVGTGTVVRYSTSHVRRLSVPPSTRREIQRLRSDGARKSRSVLHLLRAVPVDLVAASWKYERPAGREHGHRARRMRL